MLKKLLLTLLPFAAIALLTSEQMSDNGKAGKTGSPGELNCTDCHGSYALNSGGGSVSLQAAGMPTFQYTAGQTYTMSVTVTRSANSLFGIGLEALTATNANAGTLTVTDAASTSIKNATVSGVSRRNLVHTFDGGASSGSKVFNFSWTAPATGTGNVTFYYAGVACNGNGSESGDYVYTGSQVFTEQSCAAPAQPGTITGNTTVCSGTSLTYSIAAVSGATSYTWTLPSGWTGSSTTTSINVVSGTSAGNISVTANSSCGNSSARTLAVTSSNVSVNTTGSAPTCHGTNNGSATAVVSGGSGSYNYSWSPSGGSSATASNLAPGTYTVTITDGSSCSYTSTVNIVDPPVLVASAGSNLTTCSGSGVVLGASPAAIGGTGAYTYLWDNASDLSAANVANPTASPAANTTYTLLVTDANGCTATSSVNVTIGSSLFPVINMVAGALVSSITGTSYEWYLNGVYIPGANSNTYVPTAVGNYEVVVYDAGGCFGVSPVFVVTSVGISDITANNSLKLYPNPASGILNIKTADASKDLELSIYDVTGRQVFQSLLQNGIHTVDISSFESGVYSVIVENGNERMSTRFLVNHK